jgi:hypothetical protein
MMGKKEILIESREQIYADMKIFIANLGETDRAAEGTPEEWAIKNALIHVALWDERMGQNLQSINAGQQPKDYSDYDNINDKEFLEHQNDSWEAVEELIDRSQVALLEGLTLLDEDKLTRNDVLYGNQERQTWARIASTCVTHPMIHVTEHLVKKGETDRALKIVLDLSDTLEKLDEDDQWRGLLDYNRACYFALAGQKSKALDRLANALPLNPGLVEWSKQDSDLDSLRKEPEYLALYEN